MEDNYFILHDNMEEIISITHSHKIVYYISISRKSLTNYFYHLSNINETFVCNHSNLHLTKFIKLKELVCYNNFLHNVNILTCLSSLTTLNSLKIRFRIIRDFENINIEHFQHLTSLCFSKYSGWQNLSEPFIYHRNRIKYLTNVLETNDFTKYNLTYYNLERWNLTIARDYKDYFNSFICTRLTRLKLSTNHGCKITFHENYLTNLLELKNKNALIHHNNFSNLTLLQIYNDMSNIYLNKMMNLKILMIRDCYSYSKRIHIQNAQNINCIFIDRMKHLNIGSNHVSNYRNYKHVTIDDDLFNLTCLKINAPLEFEIHVSDPSKLSHLKCIEYNNLKFTNINNLIRHVVTDRIWIVHGEIKKKEWKRKQMTTHLVLINNKGFKNLDVFDDLRRLTYANEKKTYDNKKFRIRKEVYRNITGWSQQDEVKVNCMNVNQCKDMYLQYI